jgi:hypothetical protein
MEVEKCTCDFDQSEARVPAREGRTSQVLVNENSRDRAYQL